MYHSESSCVGAIRRVWRESRPSPVRKSRLESIIEAIKFCLTILFLSASVLERGLAPGSGWRAGALEGTRPASVISSRVRGSAIIRSAGLSSSITVVCSVATFRLVRL
jgi:hypothetical protein